MVDILTCFSGDLRYQDSSADLIWLQSAQHCIWHLVLNSASRRGYAAVPSRRLPYYTS